MQKLGWCGYQTVKNFFEDVSTEYANVTDRLSDMQFTNVTDRQTDRHRITAYTALTHMHRAVKTMTIR